jgi:hypothetical protein
MEPPTTHAILEFVQALGAVAAGVWVAFTYFGHLKELQLQEKNLSDREDRARLIEAKKPFAEVQLALFMEAGRVVGQLVAFDKSKAEWVESKEWKDIFARFYGLFWTELSIVEDEAVKKAMEKFSSQLQLVVASPQTQEAQDKLNERAYKLARQIRSSIEDAWHVKLGEITETKTR